MAYLGLALSVQPSDYADFGHQFLHAIGFVEALDGELLHQRYKIGLKVLTENAKEGKLSVGIR